jgi:hypothetical protein
MMQRLTLATTPWSHDESSTVDICAMAMAMASPLVVIRTTSSYTSIPDSVEIVSQDQVMMHHASEISPMTWKLLTVSKETRNHELGTVADGVDGRVLDNDTLVGSQESLKRADDSPEVALVALVVIEVLCVQNIVQRDHALLLVHGTTPYTSQLLHVSTDTKKQTQVDTEGTDVGSGLARNPEDTELSLVVKLVQLALVDGSDTELSLDGTDQRRTLEKSSSQSLKSTRELLLAARQFVVQSDDADVLLSGTLLRLDETGGTVDADNQTTSDLGIKGARVTGPLNAEDTLDPCDDFVRRRVGGLVEVDDTAGDVRLQVALEGSRTGWDGGEMSRANKDYNGTKSAFLSLWISPSSSDLPARRA